MLQRRIRQRALRRAPQADTTQASAKPREGLRSRESEEEEEEEEEVAESDDEACVAHALATNAAVPVRSVILCDLDKAVTAKPAAFTAAMTLAERRRAEPTVGATSIFSCL